MCLAVAEEPRFVIDRLLGGRLFRDGDFLKLWVGQTVSEAGSQVTGLALPTLAILVLHATPLQVGLLAALEFLPFPTLGLVAGVYADRIRRRPIMIASDLARMALIASIPVAFLLGFRSIEQLYVVGLLVGVFNVFFGISYQSYLPALVNRSDLIEGNTKLEVSRSVAQLSGPALAGFLIQVIGAVRSLWLDAGSFLVSAASLWWIRKPEPQPAPSTASGRSGFWLEMREGIDVVFHNPTLWKIAGATATSNLSNGAFAVFLIFAYNILHLSPGTVGFIFAAAAVGGLLGALSAGWWARTLGVGLTLFLSLLIGGLVALSTPLAQYFFTIPFLVVTGFVAGFFGPVYNITQVSLRQAITPDRVQGRMNATMRTIVWGTIPIGSFAGGAVATAIGVVPTMYIFWGLGACACFWILAGPIHLRVQPEAVE